MLLITTHGPLTFIPYNAVLSLVKFNGPEVSEINFPNTSSMESGSLIHGNDQDL